MYYIGDLIAAAFVLQGVGLAIVFRKGFRGIRQHPTKYTKVFDQVPLGNAFLALMLLAAASALFYQVPDSQSFNSLNVSTVNANWIITNETNSTSFAGNSITVNTIFADTYLNLPATSVSTNIPIFSNSINAVSLAYSGNFFINSNNQLDFIKSNGGASYNSPLFANSAGAGSLSFSSNLFINSNLALDIKNLSYALPSPLVINSLTTNWITNVNTITTNTIATTNGLLTGVGQIRWNAPVVSKFQYSNAVVYTNNNATEWDIIIVYKGVEGLGSNSVTVKEDPFSPPVNTIIVGSTTGVNPLTLDYLVPVPYGMSVNIIYSTGITAAIGFNTIIER